MDQTMGNVFRPVLSSVVGVSMLREMRVRGMSLPSEPFKKIYAKLCMTALHHTSGEQRL
jgi:hypothetical protein